MGNIVPELCVCKERDGKGRNKKRVKVSISDGNIKVLDFIGLIGSAKVLTELIKPLEKYIPYEIFCISEDKLMRKHSIVKIKCISNVNDHGICIKIMYIEHGKFMIYLLPIWDEDEKGILEYKYHTDIIKDDKKLIVKSDKIFTQFVFWMKKLASKPENELQSEKNLGKTIYAYIKSLIANE